jgi:hypothetical protein
MCSEYLEALQNLNSETLKLILLLESIICIKKEVLNIKESSFFKDEEDKSENIQLCYYNCAISEYMLLEYSTFRLNAKLSDNKRDNVLVNDLIENILWAIDCVSKGTVKEQIDKFKNDMDLKSLFAQKGDNDDLFKVKLLVETEMENALKKG